MIKDRPHRLSLVYINQPLYFVTCATRDRKRIASLHRAQIVIEDMAIARPRNLTLHLDDT